MSIPDGTTPFSQIDWSVPYPIRPSEGFVDQAIWSFVIPFSQSYWPRTYFPQFPKAPITQALNLNLFKNPIPFGPFDYNKSAFPRYPKEPVTQALNLNLFTNKIPFGPFDWNKARWTPPAKEPPNWSLNLNLFKNPLPFGPYNYSKGSSNPPLAAQHPPQLALSLYANLGPFTQVDFSNARPVKSGAAPGQPYNPNIYAIVISAPLIPVDWSRPFFPPPAREPVRQALNLNLFTNPVPVFNLDFSKPFSPRSSAITHVPYNLNLFASGPVAVPFNQTDWPVTHRLSGIPGLSDQAIWAFTIPFSQTDWNRPFTPRPAVPRLEGVNIALTAPVAAIPFSQTDWPKGAGQKYFRAGQIDGAIIDISQPFNQTDWSRSYRQPASVASQFPFNPNLFTNPVPFAQTNWPKAAAFNASQGAPQPLNPNLFSAVAVTLPFAQTDWPASHRLSGIPGLSDQAIWAFTIPFFPIDWSKPVALRGAPTPDQPFNINLFTTAPPPPPSQRRPTLFIANLGRLMNH